MASSTADLSRLQRALIEGLAGGTEFYLLRVDALADLVTNKICALLGRGDIKDLIDLYFLDRAGVDVLAYLDAAKTKDGGLEPLTLSYVLGSMSTDPGRLMLIDPVPEMDVAMFRDRLVEQLLILAWPGQDPSIHG